MALKRLAKSSLDRPTGPIDSSADSSSRMRIGRTILAFLVATSLAMLPMAGAFAAPNDEPMASDTVVASAHEHCDRELIASEDIGASAHDCCDHAMPADHMMNECHGSTGCTAKCFSVVALIFSGVALPSPTGGTESPFVSEPCISQTASPPFRPPRT
jgi:hypothetical protein